MSEMGALLAAHGVELSGHQFPPLPGEQWPNWDSNRAFLFYGRFALGACACEQKFGGPHGVLRGKIGRVPTLQLRDVVASGGKELPDSPVWVDAGDRREWGDGPQAKILVIDTNELVRLLTEA